MDEDRSLRPPATLPDSAVNVPADRFAKLYEMVLDSIPSSVLLLNAQLQIVSTNRNFLQKSHLAGSQVIGRRLDEVFPPAIYQHLNLGRRVAEVFRTGVAPERERIVYRAPGLLARTYVYSLIPFRGEKKTENVMLAMEDVTEMIRLGEEARKAERHLASVVESASDIVLSMDPLGRIRTWNTAAVRITGYDEPAVQNRNLCELCAESRRRQLAQILERVRCEGRTELVEAELVSHDGIVIPISWTFSAMRDTDVQVIGLVALGRDLTERRKFEAQLIQSDKLAALGVMAGGIAHEIRNPLAVVSSVAQLLLTKPHVRQVQLECAEHIHRGVQRVAQIVESLLRFARPSDEGRKGLLDLVLVIQDAVALVGNQAKLARIEVRTNYPNSQVPVCGNAGLLQQLAANLMLNAINAMPEDGGEITLTVEKTTWHALLRVSDTGRGISSAHLTKVFDPFFTTMPVGRGTGLGLSISYSIVQQHSGTIDISSEEGIGTTVLVALPLAAEDTGLSSPDQITAES